MFASYFIVASMILDTMDGRVARLTNSYSKFGEQLDSLADLVAFGVAPAILAYQWTISEIKELGWAIIFFYVACTALRLARFNSMLGVQDSRYFCGLPSPAGAANIVTLFWFIAYIESNNYLYFIYSKDLLVTYIVAFFVALTGVLMVSNIPFSSMKKLKIKRVSTQTIAIISLLFLILLIQNHRLFLFALVYSYSIFSILAYLYKMLKKQKKDNPPIINEKK